jgi:hypothetical protein
VRLARNAFEAKVPIVKDRAIGLAVFCEWPVQFQKAEVASAEEELSAKPYHSLP